MDAGTKGEILRRLKIVQGHMRGIAHMVEEDRHPLEVVRQTCAVRRAIDRINGLLLEHHLKRCLSRTLCEGDPETRRQAVEEVVAVISGPPPCPLPAYEFQVEGDEIYVGKPLGELYRG